MSVIKQRYGRHLDDFALGETYAHPWEVTVDEGSCALFQGAFLDASPVFASAAYARELGFRGRIVHPLLTMNLALSFSVHDVSEQCIAHLAYVDMAFPSALQVDKSVHARSTCVALERNDDTKRGVVTVRTALFDETENVVCWFVRKALLHTGRLEQRAHLRDGPHTEVAEHVQRLPFELSNVLHPPERSFGFGGFFEEFSPGQVRCHQVGKTVSEGEHFMLTSLVRNSHPLHFDAFDAARGGSFTKKPVVMGGLVFAWTCALASRDLGGRLVWELGFSDGAHTGPVHAGDTLYVASKVLDVKSRDDVSGEVTVRLVALKNERPDEVLARGEDLFTSEREKAKEARIANKVFEITRSMLLWRRVL